MTGFPNTAAWQKACAADAVLATWAGTWAVCFAVRSGSDAVIFNFVEGQTAAKIPGARFQAMTGIGHFPFAENPKRFAEYLLPILAELKG
jgi:pimeloyl-ACP methyl ester carboxylesterase